MTSPSAHTPSARALWLVLAALALAIILVVASPAQPAAASCGGTTTVGTEAELNAAIAAFNAVTTGPCVFTIQLTGNILLTASTTTINNATADVALTIEGGGFAADGQDQGGTRVFRVAASTTANFDAITIQGGSVSSFPGGGGILVEGNVMMRNSTVTGNQVSNATGAGMYTTPGSTLLIENSTISNNANSESSGGGLTVDGSATIRNSTISGNSVVVTSGQEFGGGLEVGPSAGTIVLDSVTISDNTANQGAGFASLDFSPDITLTNSIVAGNTGAQDMACISSSISGSNNLIQSLVNCGFSNGVNDNIIGQAANLGPLADNGGPTQTHLPNVGSPVIDAGDTTLTVDQRGIARPQGAADDIGAVEVAAACPTSPWNAGSEAALNFAIGCFNAITAPGVYTINVTQDIALTANIDPINNPTSGVDLVISGGNHTIDGGNAPPTIGKKGFHFQSLTAVTMSDLTMTRCRSLLTGGAIHNANGELTLNNVTLSYNVAGFGGGALTTVGPVAITNSLISHNLSVTTGGGGGIFVQTPGSLMLIDSEVSDNRSDTSGGGIDVESGASLTVRNSTFSGNRAVVGSAIYSAGTLSVTNSTVSGNEETSPNQLAGAIVIASGSGALDSVTVFNNSGDILGTSGVAYAAGASGSVRNSILAGNSPGTDFRCTTSTVVALTRNLVGSVLGSTVGSSCDISQGGNITGQAPNLGPLANNGGPTQTHLPQAGSPAIDAGDTTLATDQRNFARPQGAADDIGAVEVETCPDDATVSNETELNAAIACFNARTAPGTSTITVTQNIPLTASTTAIDNATTGVALVIQGGGYAVDGQDTPGVRPFEVAVGTTVTMNEITVAGGNATGVAGGGILADGNLTLNRSTIDGNTAEGPGGGVAAGPQSAVTIVDSTLSNNASTEPAVSGGFGGGLYSVSPNLTLRNTTVSGNSATLGAGGLEIFEGGAILDSVTVADNTGGTFGSGVNVGDNATAQIDNTIVDRNSGGFPNVRCGLFISTTFSHSLVLDASVNCNITNGVNGNIVGLPANLGPLANNGGPTQTHLPGASSPAIDAGATTLAADQRGISRPRGAADDIGAVEVEVPTDLDFGDAPDGYKTTLAAGGARHVATGPTLRLGPDVEPDGLPGPNADGDDLDGNDDEDGVFVFVSSRFRQVELRTNPTNCSPGEATLACWVDIDRNGAFDNDATERRTVAVPSGTNCAGPLDTETLTYDLDQFSDGPVYARCRIAKDLSWTGSGGIAPDGLVASGEVEDYFYDLELIYDYGDLDFAYPVLKSANGARHLIENGAQAWLGTVAPDLEADGIYSPNGDGDDLSGTPDDEDGVVFPTLAPGNSADLQVTIADGDGNACLSGFVDWNGSYTLASLAYTAIDGGGPGGLLNEVSLAAGPHTITIDVPLVAGARAAFRFRLTDECDQGGFLATGAAQNGEVEDYVAPLAPLDWGDLPDGPYPTLAASNGPRHLITSASYLGSVGPDAETNGQPNLAANGDDTNGADDEDGVLVMGPMVPGLSVDIRVRVADDDGTGYVSGFADLDGNGALEPLVYTALDGSGPGGTASDLALSSGDHTLTVAVPANFTVGTPLRFRITDDSGQGGASATGQAANGEVEDYFVGAATYDFGDAPDSYMTTLAAGGAQHAVTAEPHFGARSPDSEADGFPGPAADGDDNDNLDDEDGVSVVVLKDARQLQIRHTPVNTGFDPFTVGCWIDVNRDGVFDNSLTGNERFTQSFPGPVNNGFPPYTQYDFTISLDLFTSGPVFVRCRDAFDEDWARAGGIGPNGLVASGEVEDIRYDLELLYDYGDLSDTYATLKISNGPRHLIENGTQAWLGAVAPDIETDGLPSTNADFDDIYGTAPDDEDGVVFPILVPGNSADLQVTVSDSDGNACLSGFVDWDGSGSLAAVAYAAIDGGGPGGALSDVSLAAGPHTITVDVPLTAGARAAFRFRLTDECDQGGASPTGEAPNGEVEDYVASLALLDWGDLPDGPYPTLAANNGPRHIITSASYLGARGPDAEANGQPNLEASGDDNNGADDEDGVFVLNPLVPGLSIDIKVRVADDDGTGYVSGFADLNGDGALDPLVYIALDGSGPGGTASDLALSSGDHTLTVAVPANLTFGTPLRFRITDDSGQGGASATGQAPNGEVEDYLIRVASYDFGDAPDSYKTTLAAGGAQHAVGADPYFGVRSPDSEADGFPGPAADGDDNDNFDDEDGVSVAVLQGAGLLRIRYTPINTGFNPFTVGCWIDINRDGVFDNSAGSPERWTQNFPGPVNNGFPPYTQYEFNLPLSQFSNGDLYVRCRAATDGFWAEVGGVKPDGLVRSGEVEDIVYALNEPGLAVTLASFEAAPLADHVLVTWETVSELENSGFNLYRSVAADPPSAADLLAFVPSQGPGSAQGFFYSHQDYSVTAGETYWYWLEDVDFNGATTMHEPVSVVFVGPTAVRLNGLEAAADRPALAWLWLLAGLVAIVAIVGASRLRTRRGNA